MKLERSITPLDWDTFIKKAPNCARYAKLRYDMVQQDNIVNTHFLASWRELAPSFSLKSTLFIKDPSLKESYVFKIGATVSDKVVPDAEHMLSAVFKAKDQVLENAAKCDDAKVTLKLNFTVSLPGTAIVRGPSPAIVQSLVDSANPIDSKVNMSLEEFSTHFPNSVPVMFAKNTHRILENEAKSIWAAAAEELELLNPAKDATFQVTDPITNVTYTIAVFSSRHVALKELPNNKQFIAELAQAYKNITDTNTFLKVKGLTRTKVTPFFSSYTI